MNAAFYETNDTVRIS